MIHVHVTLSVIKVMHTIIYSYKCNYSFLRPVVYLENNKSRKIWKGWRRWQHVNVSILTLVQHCTRPRYLSTMLTYKFHHNAFCNLLYYTYWSYTLALFPFSDLGLGFFFLVFLVVFFCFVLVFFF